MENFFNDSSNDVSETSIISQYDALKENYQRIFINAAESIRTEIEKLKPDNPCKLCSVNNCNITKKDIFTDYPSKCAYKEWQTKVLAFLNGDYKQKLRNAHKSLMEKQSDYECNYCGDCCRLAVSEYSYEQLKQRAFRGDKFSKDFVSVFVPYENEEDAKRVNPEYFEILNELVSDKTYYYYCPKLKDNMCSDYDNRPDICKEFPHNPLKLLPSKCSFNEWKNSVSETAMLINAKIDIIEFYKQKLG